MKMRRLNIISFALAILVTVSSISSLPALTHDTDEKRPLEHADYDKWNSISSQSISHDGKWIGYSIRPGKGDATLKIREVNTAKEFSVTRGGGLRFTTDSKFAIYTIAPDPELIKKLKKEKKKPEELPKTKLEILDLSAGKITTIENVASFTLPEKASGWLAYKTAEGVAAKKAAGKTAVTEKYNVTPNGLEKLTASKQKSNPEKKATEKAASPNAAAQENAKVKPKQNKRKQKKNAAKKQRKNKESQKNKSRESKKQATTKKEKQSTISQSQEKSAPEKSATKKPAAKKTKKNGTTLVLRNLNSNLEFRFANVVNFRFSKHAEMLAMTTSAESTENDGVQLFDLTKMQQTKIASGLGNYGQPVINEDATKVAFLTDKDDYAHAKPSWSLYLWNAGDKMASLIVTDKTDGMPEKWWIKSIVSPSFSKDGRRLMIDTAPIPDDRNKVEKPGDKADEEPKAKLDIWHWQDPFLQPQQLLRVAQDKNRSYTAIFDLKKKSFIQIETKAIPNVAIDRRSAADIAVGIASEKYDKMRSWNVPGFSDSFLIDLNTGKPTPILKQSQGAPSLSPNGKFMTWWDGSQKKWFTHSTKLGSNKQLKPVDLGKGIKFRLDNELHDTPSLAPPYGSPGWLDDDKAILIYDRWDIWQVDPTGKQKPVCITNGAGRKNSIRFRRVRLDFEERTINRNKEQILSSLDHKTKASGYYKLSPKSGPEKLLVLSEKVTGLRKAKESDAVMFTRSTFKKSPDIWASSLGFKSIGRISKANPQQHEYLWGSAELVNWKANDGKSLDGILYKPENFDSSKKYPMIVYFYERYSDNLHSYYAPAAGRSIINFSFYVSRGYVVFIPDIPYKTGEPGPSAVNAILPGVQSIVAKGFIDEKKIGMQGHSWGGYQTAYLVTQTNMFACAESGAPVSNMTSAYGGIRWGSGMSRMFQYEKTQSRIGATLWQDREKYIANSPLFFADNIKTPLLILHNDKDTAVPWYQGIELFVALRRLDKPAWMLNYNGDPHWVMSDANRKDFAKRMQQFFDHYLKDDPMPVWMAKGVPAVDKGEKFGFEPAKQPNQKK